MDKNEGIKWAGRVGKDEVLRRVKERRSLLGSLKELKG